MTSKIEELIGKQISGIRKERELTQAELAERVGVASETISRIERGVSVPSLKTLEDIAGALNVPLKELVDVDHPRKSGKSASEKEIEKVTTLLKPLKAEDIRMGYSVLKGVFASRKRR